MAKTYERTDKTLAGKQTPSLTRNLGLGLKQSFALRVFSEPGRENLARKIISQLYPAEDVRFVEREKSFYDGRPA